MDRNSICTCAGNTPCDVHPYFSSLPCLSPPQAELGSDDDAPRKHGGRRKRGAESDDDEEGDFKRRGENLRLLAFAASLPCCRILRTQRAEWYHSPLALPLLSTMQDAGLELQGNAVPVLGLLPPLVAAPRTTQP